MSITAATYLMASTAVGLAQIGDAVALLKWKGRFCEIFTSVFAVAEFVWAGVSYFVWRDADAPFPLWLPVSFIAYTAAFTAAGLFLAIQHRKEDDLPLPSHLAVAGGVFGIYFSLASLVHVASS